MNDWDRKNLNFIMNSDEATLSKWYESISDDDKLYAVELLDQYRKELDLAESLLNANAIAETTEAFNYLKKFRLQ